MGSFTMHKDPHEPVKKFMRTNLSYWFMPMGGHEFLVDALVNLREYYAAYRDADGNVMAYVYLLNYAPKQFMNFGFKPQDEEDGPLQYNCPASILDMLTPTDNVHALEWRAKCRETIEQHRRDRQTAASLVTLAKDTAVMFDDKSCLIFEARKRLIYCLAPEKWKIYKLSKAHFARLVVIEQPAPAPETDEDIEEDEIA